MASKKREYSISPITVNGFIVAKVIIDPHYELKHGKYMSDDLILQLVKYLNGRREIADATTDRFSYFVTLVEHEEKCYRLIWLLDNHAIYVGVVNAYRDKKTKGKK